MIYSLLFSTCIVALFIKVIAENYCATFSADTAAGASGYFAMAIEDGTAKYAFYLDLTSYVNSDNCSLSTYGLKYHIHSYWLNSSVTSASTIYCGDSNCGGHYDPYFGCSPSSQNEATGCTQLGRIEVDGYTYQCNTEIYNAGNYSNCEVGDISGKFGIIKPEIGNLIFSKSVFTDYYPPEIANYNVNLKNSDMWSSVIFHCGTSAAPRLLCAKISTSSTSACSSAYETFATSSSDDDQTSGVDLNTGDIVSIAICSLILGLLIGGVFIYFAISKKALANSEIRS